MEADPLARYTLGELLGTGATSEVFIAKDQKLRRDVAVKRLLPHVAEDPTVRTCFHREAQALARVRHKNVVTVHDYSGQESDVLFLVMDLVRGKSLDQWVSQRGILDEHILWAIVHELSSALEACHGQNVVHRDLKPENVILTPQGRLMLVDFGVARSFESSDGVVAQSAGTQVMGTPDFMSPEQAVSAQLTGASDVFSLGSVLYYLATGKKPFAADGVLATLKKIMAGDYLPPKQLRQALGDDIVHVITQALQKEPDKRPSAGTLAAMARRHLTKLGIKPESLIADWVTGGAEGTTKKIREQELLQLVGQLKRALDDKEKAEIKRLRKRILELDPDNETVFEMGTPPPASPVSTVTAPVKPVTQTVIAATSAKRGIPWGALIGAALSGAAIGAVAVYVLLRRQ